MVHQSVVHHEEKREVTVFALNINETKAMSVNLDFNSFGDLTMVEHQCLNGEDLYAINTFEEPTNVAPHALDVQVGSGTSFDVSLPAVSWNVIRFTY